MEKRTINPWKWQNERSYAQAIEVKKAEGTLYVSGQTAIDAKGKSSTGDMASQLTMAIANLEEVISKTDYRCRNIVRLNVYTTSSEEFFDCFSILQEWISKHDMEQATTLLEVHKLFENLKVELEATVVK